MNTSDVEDSVTREQRILNAMNNLAFTVRIVHLCVEIQSAVQPRDVTLILVSWRNTSTLRTPPLPTPLPPKKYFHSSSWNQFIFVNFIFENWILHIFLIIIVLIRCSGMFRNVPCSWFYQRPITGVRFFKKIQDWILISERIRKRISCFFITQRITQPSAKTVFKSLFSMDVYLKKLDNSSLWKFGWFPASISIFLGCTLNDNQS